MESGCEDPWAYVSRPGGMVVWATVIAVEGHAYRKEGAAMVLSPEGKGAGIISPGCLEDDLKARVPEVLASGLPELVVYDMRPEEDPLWGEAIGCGGRITVLLEPLDGEILRLLREVRDRVDRGETAVLERWRDGKGISYRLRVDNAVAGDLGTAGKAEENAAAEAGGNEGGVEGAETATGVSGMTAGGGLLHEAVFRPKTRLIVFGAGRDAPPVCELGARIGFRVVVADWRQGLLAEERFPGAAEMVAGMPRELARKLALGPKDFVVLCSHQLRCDREMLEELLPIRPAYIGVMGSPKRISVLFEGLPWTPNVHAPVGLDIGAEGPDEIAVSIAAELIARRAAIAGGRKGAGTDADRRIVFGSRKGQSDGRQQAVR
ncbi:hypothetical protein GE107_21060 [Cohnella sp. CFH 77786]|nr:hypothetical protein [Cohnella sp. CFH 77786]